MQVDHPVELRLEAKVKEQSNLEIARPQMAVDLSLCSGLESDGCFAFDHQLFVDDHVQALHRDLFALVTNNDADLALDLVAARDELAFESGSVDVLEKAEAEYVVDLVERPDDGTCQRLEH